MYTTKQSFLYKYTYLIYLYIIHIHFRTHKSINPLKTSSITKTTYTSRSSWEKIGATVHVLVCHYRSDTCIGPASSIAEISALVIIQSIFIVKYHIHAIPVCSQIKCQYLKVEKLAIVINGNNESNSHLISQTQSK